MMYKTQFNQRKALRFRQFTRKGYALFACLGRVVTIGVLSVATLRAAAVTTPDTLSVVGALATNTTDDDSPDKEATLDGVEVTGSRAPLALGQAANAGPMCHCKSGSFGTDPISSRVNARLPLPWNPAKRQRKSILTILPSASAMSLTIIRLASFGMSTTLTLARFTSRLVVILLSMSLA